MLNSHVSGLKGFHCFLSHDRRQDISSMGDFNHEKMKTLKL